MNRIFTPLLSYCEIEIESINLVEDAFGFEFIYSLRINPPDKNLIEPSKECIERLFCIAGLD